MYKTLFLLIAFSLSVFSCKKTGSLSVTVNKQSAGQPAEIAAGALVVVKNNERTYGADASAEGKALFDEVVPGAYTVSSEVFDGTGMLVDEELITVPKGKNVDVKLLLE